MKPYMQSSMSMVRQSRPAMERTVMRQPFAMSMNVSKRNPSVVVVVVVIIVVPVGE